MFHADSSTANRWTTPSFDTAGLSITWANSTYAGAVRKLTRLSLVWLPGDAWKPGFPSVPTKLVMKLTDHKTVAMFMHYVHTEDKPVRDAAELAANRRLAITEASCSMEMAA